MFQQCTGNILLCPEIKILIMFVIFPTFSISGDFFASQSRRDIRELREITTGFLFILTCRMKDYIIMYVYYYYLFYCYYLKKKRILNLKILRVFFIKVIFYFPFQ